MNRATDSKVLRDELKRYRKAERARCADRVITDEEYADSVEELGTLILQAGRVYLNERHAIQALRIGYDMTPDWHLVAEINEHDAEEEEEARTKCPQQVGLLRAL